MVGKTGAYLQYRVIYEKLSLEGLNGVIAGRWSRQTEIVKKKSLIIKVGEAFYLRVPLNCCLLARSHLVGTFLSVVYNVLVSSKTDRPKCVNKFN